MDDVKAGILNQICKDRASDQVLGDRAIAALWRLVLAFPAPPVPAAVAVIMGDRHFLDGSVSPDALLDLRAIEEPGELCSFGFTEEDRAMRTV
jgi:hypothetical protein